MSSLANYWHAVARTRDIGRRPKRVMAFGEPLVIFKSESGFAALPDRCPHRMVELSGGKVIDGQIECPYHGWRFNGQGHCTAIPGLEGNLPNYRSTSFKTYEKEGVLFVAKGKPKGEPYLHCMEDQNTVMRLVTSNTQSTLVDVAENILDATHTHFTHKGLLRGLSAERQRVLVEVTGGKDWVEASYKGEERQDGLVSRLLEGERIKTIGRFKYPGIVELEYWGPNGIVLATTFHLRDGAANHVEGIGCLVGPDNGILDHIKAFAFRPLFHIALHQDKRVLTSTSRNAKYWPNTKPIIGPLDFLREDIKLILAGKQPLATKSPRTDYIQL